MKLLIIGYSDIVRRRILPALENFDNLDIRIATRNIEKLGDEISKYKFIEGYENAIDSIDAGLVYVSLPNSMHAIWARKALQKGLHVIVDKPAFINQNDAKEIINLARSSNSLLAESTVWCFHDQISFVKNQLDVNGWTAKFVQSCFTIPKLPETNFRNNPDLGGGALSDMCAYAITPGREFFREDPCDVISHCRTFEENDRLIRDFNVNLTYPSGGVLQGVFGFAGEYKNSMSIIGEDFLIEISPVFTAPPQKDCSIMIKSKNKPSHELIPGCDMFQRFFHNVLQSLKNNSFDKFTDIVEKDANVYFQLGLKD